MGFVHIARERLTLVARRVAVGGRRKIRSGELLHHPPPLTLLLYNQYNYIFYAVSKRDISHTKNDNPLINVHAFFTSNIEAS